jgi:hypothetical protein
MQYAAIDKIQISRPTELVHSRSHSAATLCRMVILTRSIGRENNLLRVVKGNCHLTLHVQIYLYIFPELKTNLTYLKWWNVKIYEDNLLEGGHKVIIINHKII